VSRSLLIVGVLLGIISGCSAMQDGPEAVVRKAGEALRTRNRAAFYDLVDLKKLEAQFIEKLSTAANSDRYGTMRLLTGSGTGDLLGDQLAGIFAAPPDTSKNGQATATALSRQFLDVDLAVRGLGKAQVSSQTAFVPLFLQFTGDTGRVVANVQLEKQDSRWRIVGIHDLSAPIRSARRESARARGRLYLETDTDRAYVAMMKSDLRNLVTAQEAYFADHATYAASLSQLTNLYRPSTGVVVTVPAGTDKGWSGTATHPSLPGAACSVFVGSPAPSRPPGSSSSMPGEGEVYCAPTTP
jgi:hypothetical protein